MKLKHIVYEAWTAERHRKAYEEAYGIGYDAFKQGVDFEHNPFADDEIGHDGWEDGWNARARDKAS